MTSMPETVIPEDVYDALDLLESQFETVTVPEHVWDELLAGDDGLAALEELRARGFLDVERVPLEPEE